MATTCGDEILSWKPAYPPVLNACCIVRKGIFLLNLIFLGRFKVISFNFRTRDRKINFWPVEIADQTLNFKFSTLSIHFYWARVTENERARNLLFKTENRLFVALFLTMHVKIKDNLSKSAVDIVSEKRNSLVICYP